MKVVQAQGDDWNGLFIDGRLVMEDHRLKTKDIQAAMKDAGVLGTEIQFKEVDMDWMYEVGSFPINMSEVVWDEEDVEDDEHDEDEVDN
jgi:hypothetical protein